MGMAVELCKVKQLSPTLGQILKVEEARLLSKASTNQNYWDFLRDLSEQEV